MLRLRRETHKAPFLKVQCSTRWLKWRRDIFISSDSVDGGGKLLTVVAAVWFLHCRCSLQNWTTPKILLSISLSLAILFLYIYILVIYSTPIHSRRKQNWQLLKSLNWLQCCLSNHQTQIIYILKYLLALKKENKFINIPLPPILYSNTKSFS